MTHTQEVSTSTEVTHKRGAAKEFSLKIQIILKKKNFLKEIT